jgi:hypothetical protein
MKMGSASYHDATRLFSIEVEAIFIADRLNEFAGTAEASRAAVRESGSNVAY